MLLHIQPYKEPFQKEKAQRAGEVIFIGKPSQQYLFNFLCGISAVNNGVVSIAFKTIANHMSKKFNKTMTVQAVSQLVKKLVCRGVIDYFSPKVMGVNEVGTFRIAPLHTLTRMAKEIQSLISAQFVAHQEEKPEIVETIKVPKNRYTSPIPQKRRKRDSAYLPSWAKTTAVPPQKQATLQQQEELRHFILQNLNSANAI